MERIQKQYPDAIILDVTSSSPYHSVQILSPFYPHYNIPIPFTDGLTATCVEAVWQGLKVFKSAGVDFETFKNDSMKSLKRTVRKYGSPLGHMKGAYGTELLDYYHARMEIYLPTYKWVLDNIPEVHQVVEKIRRQSLKKDIVFLDYNTNINVLDTRKPISHAGLLKLYIEGNYPDYEQLKKWPTPVMIPDKEMSKCKSFATQKPSSHRSTKPNSSERTPL